MLLTSNIYYARPLRKYVPQKETSHPSTMRKNTQLSLNNSVFYNINKPRAFIFSNRREHNIKIELLLSPGADPEGLLSEGGGGRVS